MSLELLLMETIFEQVVKVSRLPGSPLASDFKVLTRCSRRGQITRWPCWRTTAYYACMCIMDSRRLLASYKNEISDALRKARYTEKIELIDSLDPPLARWKDSGQTD